MWMLFAGELRRRWAEVLLGALAIAVVVAALVAQRTVTSSAESAVHELAHRLGTNMLVLPASTDLEAFYAQRYGPRGLPDATPSTILSSPLAAHIRAIEARLYGNLEVNGAPVIVVGQDLGWPSLGGLEPVVLGAAAARMLNVAPQAAPCRPCRPCSRSWARRSRSVALPRSRARSPAHEGIRFRIFRRGAPDVSRLVTLSDGPARVRRGRPPTSQALRRACWATCSSGREEARHVDIDCGRDRPGPRRPVEPHPKQHRRSARAHRSCAPRLSCSGARRADETHPIEHRRSARARRGERAHDHRELAARGGNDALEHGRSARELARSAHACEGREGAHGQAVREGVRLRSGVGRRWPCGAPHPLASHVERPCEWRAAGRGLLRPGAGRQRVAFEASNRDRPATRPRATTFASWQRARRRCDGGGDYSFSRFVARTRVLPGNRRRSFRRACSNPAARSQLAMSSNE